MMRLPALVAIACLVGTTAFAQKPGNTTPIQPLGTPPACTQPFDTSALCIPLDGSFQVVQFDGPGGSGSAQAGDPCQLNDDDVSSAIPLQFVFDFFGSPRTEIFINNNGNCTFGGGLTTFTPFAFPSAPAEILAPFFGDVDTRGGTGGTVWFRSEPNRFVVTWDHVGYYNQHDDLLNTFQLIITDGTDPLIGVGNNVCFCWGDMSWTTGDASQGSGGFGGVPAIAGVNAGDGVNFFTIGRFDHAGSDYDGPDGNVDGVDYLDNSATCFSVGNQLPGNVPPIATNVPANNKLNAIVGVPLTYTIGFIPPEDGQTITSINVNSNGLAGFMVDSVNGLGTPNASVTFTYTPANSAVGMMPMISIVGTDNDAQNPLSTTVPVTFCVDECFMLGGFQPIVQQVTGDDFLRVNPVRIDGMTLANTPLYDIPNIPGLVGFPVYFQALLYNPEVFPTDPVKMSPLVKVTIGMGTEILGPSTGLVVFPHNQTGIFNPGEQIDLGFSIVGF
ncbi:MAG: hypothetical protein R3F20_07675 [Planctomycetota bacterium]